MLYKFPALSKTKKISNRAGLFLRIEKHHCDRQTDLSVKARYLTQAMSLDYI